MATSGDSWVACGLTALAAAGGALATVDNTQKADGRSVDKTDGDGLREVDFAWPGQRNVAMREQQHIEDDATGGGGGESVVAPDLPPELQGMDEESLLHWALQHSDPGIHTIAIREKSPTGRSVVESLIMFDYLT